MGREIDVALVALRDTLRQFFAGLPRPPDKAGSAWNPEFRLVGDLIHEMEYMGPVLHLSVDDMRRPVEAAEDRMTGLTYAEVVFRGILSVPRNLPARAGLDAAAPQLGERRARDLAATMLASMRRRMLYYTGGDQTGVYRGVTPEADVDHNGVTLKGHTEYWPALHSPLIPMYCRRIRGADAAAASTVGVGGADETVTLWEIAWQADVAIDPRVFPAGRLYEDNFRFARFFATVAHGPDRDGADGDPELVSAEGPA